MKEQILEAALPVLPASLIVHGMSQTTTTSGATHSLQEPLLLLSLRNPSSPESWGGRWNFMMEQYFHFGCLITNLIYDEGRFSTLC